jgi:hypothetical protein
MTFSKKIVTALLVGVFSSTLVVSVDVDAGYDPYSAAQAMVDKASYSWEWGTAAEALLELYDNDLSVFGSNPFPGGNIPSADPATVLALEYAKQFINTNGQVFVSDSAVGDPASLGVSAILIGQSDSTYIDASNRQADYILNQAPRWSNGAISQRGDVAEIWADNMAMSFPFCTPYISLFISREIKTKTLLMPQQWHTWLFNKATRLSWPRRSLNAACSVPF